MRRTSRWIVLLLTAGFGWPVTVLASVPVTTASVLAKERPSEWNGALGPVRLRIVLSPGPNDRGQPLLAVPETGETVFIIRDGPGHARIGYDRRGEGCSMSELMPLSESGTDEVDISIGSLMPAPEAGLYKRLPRIVHYRSAFLVRLNGGSVFTFRDVFPIAKADDVAFASNTAFSSLCSGYFEGQVISAAALNLGEMPVLEARLNRLATGPLVDLDGYTGPVHLKIVFPVTSGGRSEPILVSGSTSRADFLYVRYLDARHLRIGLDHWGAAEIVSDPIGFEPGVPYDLIVSAGFLLPDSPDGALSRDPRMRVFKRRLFVSINAKRLIDAPVEMYPAMPDDVLVGENDAGGTTTGSEFTGRIDQISRIGVDEFLSYASIGQTWEPRAGLVPIPGPLRLRIHFPEKTVWSSEPIVTTGKQGAGDFVFVRYEPGQVARIGVDHWGGPLTLSEPFSTAGPLHEVEISLGSLFPPPDSSLYKSQPELAADRQRLVVTVDHHRLLDRAQPFFASRPDEIAIGANYIGGSSADSNFKGSIEVVKPETAQR